MSTTVTHNTTTTHKENTMNTIQEIAAIYAESAEAAENFINTRERTELDRHSELFRSASEKFKALIEDDHNLFECALRELSYSITQHNFDEARSIYAEIVKDTTTDTNTKENTMSTKKYAVSNSNTYNTIIRTGGFDLRTTVSGPKIVHTNLTSRMMDRVATVVIDSDDNVSVKVTDIGFEMMEEGNFEGFYEELKEVESIANEIQEAWDKHNTQLDHYKWENQELTTGQVAELMGFSAEMIRRWCVEGRIKSRETSRGRKITRREAFSFMESHPKFNS